MLKANRVIKPVSQARQDIAAAVEILCNIGGGVMSQEQEYDLTAVLSDVDELYDQLGTAKVNVDVALNLLRPHTSYFKGETDDR